MTNKTCSLSFFTPGKSRALVKFGLLRGEEKEEILLYFVLLQLSKVALKVLQYLQT